MEWPEGSFLYNPVLTKSQLPDLERIGRAAHPAAALV